MTFDPVAPPANEPPKKKGKILLLVGGILSVIAIVLMVAMGGVAWQGMKGFVDMPMFDAPGSTTFNAEANANLGIYIENAAVPGGLELTVTDPSGDDVPVEQIAADVEVNMGEEANYISGFDTNEAGEYTITATLPEGETASLAIGPGIEALTGTGVSFLVGFCVGIPLLLAGVVCLIIGLIRRLSS